jgi:hypothetical protein
MFNIIKDNILNFIKYLDTNSLEHKEFMGNVLFNLNKNVTIPFVEWGTPKLYQAINICMDYNLDYIPGSWLYIMYYNFYIYTYICQYAYIFLPFQWQINAVSEVILLCVCDIHSFIYIIVFLMGTFNALYNFFKKKSLYFWKKKKLPIKVFPLKKINDIEIETMILLNLNFYNLYPVEKKKIKRSRYLKADKLKPKDIYFRAILNFKERNLNQIYIPSIDNYIRASSYLDPQYLD